MIPTQEAECALAVARTGSFRRAAQEVFLSQPAVSTYVARLERRLKVVIFNRSPNGAEATRQGREVLVYLESLMTMHAQVAEECLRISKAGSSRLTVAAQRTALVYHLPPLIKVLCGLIEGLAVTFTHANDREVAQLVVGKQADIGVGCRLAGTEHSHPQILEHPLTLSPCVLFVPDHHRLAAHSVIAPSDLEAEAVITLRSEFAERHDAEFLNGVTNVKRFWTEDEQLALTMTAEGVGVTMLMKEAGVLGPPSLVAVPTNDDVYFEQTALRVLDEPLTGPASVLWDLITAPA